jgi:hypothetical protein
VEWRIEEIPELRGYTVEWAEPDLFYLSRRNVLYRSGDLRPPFQPVAAIEAVLWRRLAARSRQGQRLLRFAVTNVVRLDSGELFVTFDKTVGIVKDGLYKALDGLVRPCRVLRSACSADASGNIFFGEYLDNKDRGEIHVYKYAAGTGRVEVVHTFPAGQIRHIHGIYADPFTSSLFCLTGDHENECRILETPDEFRTVNVVGEGDETWRAVSILFTEDAFFYGTDAEFRANNIFRVERESLARRSLAAVDGTVFYSKRIGDDLFFTTTAENAPSQKENAAALWLVGVQGDAQEAAKFQKDRWHPTLFQFGTIHFPYRNDLDDTLYFHLVAVSGDNRTYKITKGR